MSVFTTAATRAFDATTQHFGIDYVDAVDNLVGSGAGEVLEAAIQSGGRASRFTRNLARRARDVPSLALTAAQATDEWSDVSSSLRSAFETHVAEPLSSLWESTSDTVSSWFGRRLSMPPDREGDQAVDNSTATRRNLTRQALTTVATTARMSVGPLWVPTYLMLQAQLQVRDAPAFA